MSPPRPASPTRRVVASILLIALGLAVGHRAGAASTMTVAGVEFYLPDPPLSFFKGKEMNWGKGGASFKLGTKVLGKTPNGGYFTVEDAQLLGDSVWLRTKLNGQTGWVKRADVMRPVVTHDHTEWAEIGDMWMREKQYGKAYAYYCVAIGVAKDSKKPAVIKDMASRAIGARLVDTGDKLTSKYSKLFGMPYQYRGWERENEEEFAASISDFTKQIENGWKTHMGHLDRGWSHEQQGDYAEAEADYRAAVKIKSDYGLAHRNLAHLSRKLGKPIQAIESLRSAASLEEKNGHNPKWLGIGYLHIGFPKRATQSFKDAIAMQPGLAEEVLPWVEIAERSTPEGPAVSEYKYGRAFPAIISGQNEETVNAYFVSFETIEEGIAWFEEHNDTPPGTGFDPDKPLVTDEWYFFYEVLERKDDWVRIRDDKRTQWMPDPYLQYDSLGALSADDAEKVKQAFLPNAD